MPRTNDSKDKNNELYQKFAFESKVKSANSFLYFYKNGVTQKILHHLKYKGKKGLGILLGSWFAPELRHLSVDIILPVPLHRTKYRRRSYNQSEQIGLGISSVLDVEIRVELVKREVDTQTQTRMAKAKRWTNMENVFGRVNADLSGLSVLLIDDVITTGATIGMLCERLVEAGVNEIHVASIARGK